MFCEHCGASIDADSKFCANCGNSLQEGLVAQRPARSYALRRGSKRPPKRLQAVLILSIPITFILLIVVWFLSGVVGDRREGFEKFLPDSTVFYAEIYDPIGLLLDLEKSLFFKRLSTSQVWKEELENFNKAVGDYKNILARMSSLRRVIGPAGVAYIPSFSNSDLLFFARIERQYVGAAKTGLEQFLTNHGIQFRKSERAGKIRYDLTSGYSLLVMDSGIVGTSSGDTLSEYTSWLDGNDRLTVLDSAIYRKVPNRSGIRNDVAGVYISSVVLGSIQGATTNPSGQSGTASFPQWASKLYVEIKHGLLFKSFLVFTEDSAKARRLIDAFQQPISNQFLKYLPTDVVAFGATNVAVGWELAKDEIRRSGQNDKGAELLKLFDSFKGEGLMAWLPGSHGIILWGLQKKSPTSFLKNLEEVLLKGKGARQLNRYGDHEIICYTDGGSILSGCFVEVDDFLFSSLDKAQIHKVLDVRDKKVPSFQGAIKSDEVLKEFFRGEKQGLIYVDLKMLLKSDLILILLQQANLMDGVRNVSKPLFLAAHTNLREGVFEGQAVLSLSFAEIGELLLNVAEKPLSEYRARWSTYRARYDEAKIKADLHNAAMAQEVIYANNHRYTTRVKELIGYNRRTGVDLRVDFADARYFILSARKTGQQIPYWTFDSRTGAIIKHETHTARREKSLTAEDPWIRGLAEHLARNNAKLYCASWAPHCQDQKELFGHSAHRLPYVECSPAGPRTPQAVECKNAGIRSYPTWILNGRRYVGTQAMELLAAHSGFKERARADKPAPEAPIGVSSVVGQWDFGSWGSLELSVSGQRVTGIQRGFNFTVPVNGTVDRSGKITLRLERENGCSTIIRGQLSRNGAEMPVSIEGCNNYRAEYVLKRK